MGYSIVNILGGLLIVTSTMVVVSKNIKHAINWYAVQSLVLGHEWFVDRSRPPGRCDDVFASLRQR